ncbi:hypothetical protein M9Y10_037364 [Tritrichomonas musculus]|uniref:non-specific serine/threonine protein kinase n=1 Tax=Tritrichomonas musculus TaxID=1915356 RepID=A0ABR2GUH3_9EUKA
MKGIVKEGYPIGSGVGGRIYKVFMKKFYALKEIILNGRDTEKVRKFLAEYELMHMLNHPNILKAYGLFLGDKESLPSILLDMCSMNLEEYLTKMSPTKVKIVFIIYQIIEGMKYIHFRNKKFFSFWHSIQFSIKY